MTPANPHEQTTSALQTTISQLEEERRILQEAVDRAVRKLNSQDLPPSARLEWARDILIPQTSRVKFNRRLVEVQRD